MRDTEVIHMILQVHNQLLSKMIMEGDGDDEDNDIDQQEPLPRLTTYKQAGYNCFGRCVLFLYFWL